MRYTKRKDGYYKCKVWDGTYKDGKKHYIQIYAETIKELEEKKLKHLTAENLSKTNIDLLTYSKNWLEKSKSFKEKNTYNMYSLIINSYLKSFKDKPPEFLCYDTVQKIINDNAEHPRTCQQIRLTLKQISKSLEMDKLIPRGTTEETFMRVQLPKYTAKEKRSLTDFEKKAISKAEFPLMEKAIVYTLYFTGMRREEILALTKNDIADGYINVNKAIAFDGKNPYVKTPKSKRGTRKIPLPSALKTIYDEYIPTLSGDVLFPMEDGTYMTKSRWHSTWEHIRSQIGTDVTAHLFRHNYCTQLCYEAATNRTLTTKKIAEMLGDTEQMVIQVYSHIIEDMEKTKIGIESALKL